MFKIQKRKRKARNQTDFPEDANHRPGSNSKLFQTLDNLTFQHQILEEL